MSRTNFTVTNGWLVAELQYDDPKESWKPSFWPFFESLLRSLDQSDAVLAVLGKHDSDGTVVTFLQEARKREKKAWVSFVEDGPLRQVFRSLFPLDWPLVEDLDWFLVKNGIDWRPSGDHGPRRLLHE